MNAYDYEGITEETHEINPNWMFDVYTDAELFKVLKQKIDHAKEYRMYGIAINVPKGRRWSNDSEAFLGQLGIYIMRHKEEMALMDYIVAKRTGYDNKFDEIMIIW